MRKIASNYIITPRGEIVERGYFLVEAGRVCGWSILPSETPEIHGVEFYAGMLVPGDINLAGSLIGEPILDFLNRIDYLKSEHCEGLSLLSCLKWSSMSITNETRVSLVV